MRCLNFQDLKNLVPKPVKVELDQGYFFVRQLVGNDVVAIQKAGKETEAEFLARLISSAVVDDDGKPIFNQEEALSLPADLFQTLGKKVVEANGLGEKKD
jgi:hypothetical protein